MLKGKIKIGISFYGSKIQKYFDWLFSYSDDIEIIRLNHLGNIPEELLTCTGLLLTGGNDINPEIYGQTNEKGLSRDIDDERDHFERALIDVALNNNLPLLGICRGLQIVNAHLGGTLFQNIENHKNENSSEDIEHRINVENDSLLYKIVNQTSGVVNSSHHQAVHEIADELKASSYSDDNIIESLEWKVPENKSPLLLVQWHPERMRERNNNPFSKEILKWFIECQIK